jgi:predicted deacylase
VNRIAVARLSLNQGAYRGERIDFEQVEADLLAAARSKGWEIESRPWKQGAPALHFLQRKGGGKRKLYVSSGIHGDEPAAILAMQRLLELDQWPSDVDLFVCPILNPEGSRNGTRTNADDVDINRDYRHFRSREAAVHVDWLTGRVPFDLAICLHEDWEAHGFYLYELNPFNRVSLAPAMLIAAGQYCPLDPSEMIDGRPSHSPGLIRPQLEPGSRPEWPEALWLLTHHTPRGYTLEAPSDWPLQVRVQTLVAALQAGVAAWMDQAD